MKTCQILKVNKTKGVSNNEGYWILQTQTYTHTHTHTQTHTHTLTHTRRYYKLTVRTEYLHILAKALIICNFLFVNLNEIVFILLTKYRHIVLLLYANFLAFDLFLKFLLLNWDLFTVSLLKISFMKSA